MRQILLIGLLFIVPFIIWAQKQINVHGEVRDAVTQKPISNVKIIVKNSTYGTFTDSLGQFSFEVLGREKIEISCKGYQTQIIKASEDFVEIWLKSLFTKGEVL